MSLIILFGLLVLLIFSIFSMYYINCLFNENSKYIKVIFEVVIMIVILVSTFYLLYVMFGLSLVISISSILLEISLYLILIGQPEPGVGLGISVIFFGFGLIGLIIPVEFDYEKLNNYEKCKIDDKYVYLYKGRDLISNKDSDVLYLERGINSYNGNAPEEIRLVVDKRENK